MEKITYIYQAGRTARLENMNTSAKEFFYGYFQLKEKLGNVNFLEFDLLSNSRLTNNLNQFLRKISGLPFFSDLIINKMNKKTLLESKTIVCTNQRVGFSILFMLLLNSTKKINSIVFVMGLFNNNPKNVIKKFFRNFFTILFMKTFKNIIFLSSGEYQYVKHHFPQYDNKTHFLPFSIDQKFWTLKNSDTNIQTDKNVLFIGNDGKRDYKFVIELASKMPDVNFTFITKQINIDEIKSKNVTLLNGKWDDLNITDLDIKTYYQHSSISIIPIFKSLQPSGQSVALQSISMGVPVLITKSDGFWEPTLFEDNKHIIFIDENKVHLWKDKIEDMLGDVEKYKLISSQGKNLVKRNNNLETFSQKLMKIIDS
jgi:glycosyltransferase involved in cell wall biosynthesis